MAGTVTKQQSRWQRIRTHHPLIRLRSTQGHPASWAWTNGRVQWSRSISPLSPREATAVRLKDEVKGPTILSLLYYKCPDACSIASTSHRKRAAFLADKPETAPNVISISVDENETPADAMKAKDNRV